MAIICSTESSIDAAEGCFKTSGKPKGFALAESELIGSKNSMILQSFWDAQAIDGTNRINIFWGADDSEIIPAEQELYEPPLGDPVQENAGKNKYVFKVKDTACSRKTLKKINGKSVNVIFFMSQYFMRSLPEGQKNRKTIKCNCIVKSETGGNSTGLKTIEFSSSKFDLENDFAEDKIEFNPEDVAKVTGLYLEMQSASITEAIVRIVNCEGLPVTGLTTTNLTYYDLTAGAAVSGTITDEGDGEYKNTATFTLGNNIEVRYTGPAAGNLYVQTENDFIEVT